VEQTLRDLRRRQIRRLVVYGAGAHTSWLLSEFDLGTFQTPAIVDDDSRLHGIDLLGIPVTAPGAPGIAPDAVLVSSDSQEARLVQRATEAFPDVPVIRLYATTPSNTWASPDRRPAHAQCP
jgi:hypothetical protein